jgi:hypothetical protein
MPKRGLLVVLGVAVTAALVVPLRGAPHVIVEGSRFRVPPTVPPPTPRRPLPPASIPPANVAPPSERVPPNVRVTRDDLAGSYVRHDGRQDRTTDLCSIGRREQNEPSVAVDPRRPEVVAAGANEYCTEIATGDGWLGYYRSTDGAATWHDSLVPGDPSDGSKAGLDSPAREACSIGSDPSLSFDANGRLFYAFICFQRVQRDGGRNTFGQSSTFVATYDQDGARYIGTALVGRGSRTVDEDKINLAVDQTGGQFGGNVYTAWVELAPPQPGGFPQDLLRFSRSTDHGGTFSPPSPVSDIHHAVDPDIAVGPDGAVYVSFRAGGGAFVAKSTDGGRSFGLPHLVESIVYGFPSYDYSAGSGRDCGDGPYRCDSPFTFSRFDSFPTIAADRQGIHVAWVDRLNTPPQVAQAKIFVKTSPDGVTWSEPATVLDQSVRGHQYFPDMTSRGVLTLVFYDTRHDPAYDPFRPPGNTKKGHNSGGAVDVFAARSTDGGRTWTEQRVTSRSNNYNFETPGPVPFWGDYIYVSAAGSTVIAVWTDSRDLVPAKRSEDGFDVYEPCGSSRPFVNDPCLSKGGHDQNIYTARL